VRDVVARRLAALLLLALGCARGIGGAVVLDREPVAMAIGLLAVGILCLVAGILVWRAHRAAPRVVLVALVAFLAGGFVNGTVLYGKPRVAGLLGNLIYAVVVTALLQRAQRGERGDEA
jgi:hypothetical protein